MVKANVLKNIREYSNHSKNKPTIYIGDVTRIELLLECEKDLNCDELWGCKLIKIGNVKYGYYLV